MFNFLDAAALADSGMNASGEAALGGLLAGLIAMSMAMAFVFMILSIVVPLSLWIYQSFAYSAIAKKNKQKNPALAWIPCFGPAIIAYKASKMKSWPWFLLLGFVAMLLVWIPILGIVLYFLGGIAVLIFAIYVLIWHWKMLEAIGKPGWWLLFLLIPLFGGLVFLILIGVAAWSKK